MGAWGTRGLRGSGFEELINRTNEQYKEKNLALIQKIPTPITPVEFNKEKRLITKAYFEERSTVDYIGVVQGIPVCFDAKECRKDRFPLANIHPHQVAFMKQFRAMEGVAFLLIYFSETEEIYFMTFEEMEKFWERKEKGGRKSFNKNELREKYFIKPEQRLFVPYLEGISIYLQDINKGEL